MDRMTCLALLWTIVGASCSANRIEPAPLIPATRITHDRIGECSGIVWLDGAYVVHNDSGDDPVLYRSPTLDFTNAEVLSAPIEEAIDWEDITVFEGDLLVGDIGDNRRERDDITLYRLSYASGALELRATYPVRYPDERHDAEGLTVVDGKVCIISKAREEKVTNVYIFDELHDQADNVPRLASQLEIGEGEQITAADTDPETGTLVLLTYTHILRYAPDRIAGPPEASTLIGARQCEALCFHGHQLIITNEQRDVFVLDEFLRSRPDALLPPRGAGQLPVTGTHLPLPLKNAREGEQFSWRLDGEILSLHAELCCSQDAEPTVPAEAEGERARIGSSIILAFGIEERLRTTAQEFLLTVGVTNQGESGVWRLDVTGPRLQLQAYEPAQAHVDVADSVLTVDLAFPLAEALGQPLPSAFLFDLHGIRLRGDEEEVRFSGIDSATLWRPYLWGRITVGADR